MCVCVSVCNIYIYIYIIELFQTSVPVSMQLEIAPQHHLFIIGRNGVNIKQILQQTGATIRFPDPSNSVPQHKGTVYISGTIESVFLARQQLIVSIERPCSS